MSQIIRFPEVLNMSGLGRSTVYHMIKKGSFPNSIKLGDRAVGWQKSDVEQWLSERIEQSRARTLA